MLSRDACAPTCNDGEVEVSCVIMDNSTILEALVHYSIDGGDYQIVNMVSDGDSTYTGVISVSNGNTVYYYITATDDGVDQAEPKTSVYPYDIYHDQLGFHVTDELTIKTIQETPWPSGRHPRRRQSRARCRWEGQELVAHAAANRPTDQCSLLSS